MFTYRAKRKLSIGPEVLEPGDVLTEQVISYLPVGRLFQLRDTGHIEEVSDQEGMVRLVANLEARVIKLEALLNGPARRPGRPMKVKEDTEDGSRILSEAVR